MISVLRDVFSIFDEAFTHLTHKHTSHTHTHTHTHTDITHTFTHTHSNKQTNTHTHTHTTLYTLTHSHTPTIHIYTTQMTYYTHTHLKPHEATWRQSVFVMNPTLHINPLQTLLTQHNCAWLTIRLYDGQIFEIIDWLTDWLTDWLMMGQFNYSPTDPMNQQWTDQWLTTDQPHNAVIHWVIHWQSDWVTQRSTTGWLNDYWSIKQSSDWLTDCLSDWSMDQVTNWIIHYWVMTD